MTARFALLLAVTRGSAPAPYKFDHPSQASPPVTVAAVSCKGEDGEFVDYLSALKVHGSAEYYYRDATSPAYFSKSPHELTTNASGVIPPDAGAIMETLRQLYERGDSFAYALYNDEPPRGTQLASRAHSKGVILFDGERGFWLVHSFPKWPDFPKYAGLSSNTYGQSFFCMSFDADQLESIADIQWLQWPEIYAKGISDDLVDQFPRFSKWIDGDHAKTSDVHSKTTALVSHEGRAFTHYGKSHYCKKAKDDINCDLWADLIAPGLNDSLRVETWQNGPQHLKMPTFCAGDGNYTHDVQNVSVVEMRDGTSWLETQDHSKWGVSTPFALSACIGDINRQYSQEKRGGGAVCFQDQDHWASFDAIVKEAFLCP